MTSPLVVQTSVVKNSAAAITREWESARSDASRLTRVKDGATVLVEYDYFGVADVVGTSHDQPDVMWKMYTKSPSYSDLDRFNRVVSSRWTKELATVLEVVFECVDCDAKGAQ